MNALCSHIIPFCLAFVLLLLLYWIVKLNKIRDYKYTFREYWKIIRGLAAEIQRKMGCRKLQSIHTQQPDKITVIDLDNDHEWGDLLSNSETKRKYSIKIDSTSDDIKRKNSIDYSIQLTSNQLQTHYISEQSSPGELIPLKIKESQENLSTSASNSHRNLCFPTTLQVNTILPKGKTYVPVKESTKSGLRQSTDYLKMYKEYQKKTRTELVSMKCARSIENLQKRVTFRNLCEMNGIKTIRDLISEGA